MVESKDANVLSNYKSEKLGMCILCNIPLDKKYDTEEAEKKTPERFILQCPKCEKFYFPKYEIVKHQEKFGSVHDDINESLETKGIGVFEGAVLLSGEEDNRFYPKDKQKKKNYLQDHFPNANIVSRDY